MDPDFMGPEKDMDKTNPSWVVPAILHIGLTLMHSESAKKFGFIGLKCLVYCVEHGSALGFLVFQFFLVEILLQSWEKWNFV